MIMVQDHADPIPHEPPATRGGRVSGDAALEASLREAVDGIFEHLNGNHADSVLFLAAHVAGGPLVDAELSGIDGGGIDLAVRDDTGARTLRIPFTAPVASTADVQGLLLGTLAEARAAAADGPLTSIESEMASQGSIPTRVVEVAAVADIAPGLRQITFGGMRGHRAIGPDDFFLVIRPKPGFEHLLDEGADFATYRDLPEADQPDWAYYTCRRWRPEAGELDAWFVLHDHDGPISGWARRAAVGDRVALWGPRVSFEPPEATTSLLLVGDETGLGAFAAILESTDPAISVVAVVECDGAPPLELPERAGSTVHWIDRNGAPHGTGTQLLDAVRDLPLETRGLYAYGAGESRIVTAVRKHLRHDRGIPGPQVQMVGYWRRDDA